MLLEKAGDTEAAKTAWRQGIELGHGGAASNLGGLLAEAGDTEAAKTAWRQGIELGEGGAAFNLGVLLEEAGDTEAAKTAWRQGIELGHGGAAFNLGVLLDEAGDTEAAKRSANGYRHAAEEPAQPAGLLGLSQQRDFTATLLRRWIEHFAPVPAQEADRS